MLNKNLFTSDKSQWETPDTLFQALDNEFHFTLDVCASETNSKCPNYFDEKSNCLTQTWSGVCFMNPPYGREIKYFVEKAYFESQKNAIVVCLLPVRTDTKWWHKFCMKSYEIRLLTRRLSFSNSDNKAPFPGAVIIFKSGNYEPRLKAQVI